MRPIILTATLLALASPALAGDKTVEKRAHPPGAFVGHDGKLWKMVGCAAYPVDAAGRALPLASTPKVLSDEQAKRAAYVKRAKDD